jgi:hypothetical protein
MDIVVVKSSLSNDEQAEAPLDSDMDRGELLDRRNPRLLEYARRVSPVPKFTAKNAFILVSLFALKCCLVASICAHNQPATIVSAVIMMGWCCCPCCAIERELRSTAETEAEFLMEDGDDAA